MRARSRAMVIAATLLTGLGVVPALASPAPAAVPKQPAECCAATGADVPKVGGDFGDQDYSSLDQITTGNVGRLAGAWLDHLENGAAATRQEATPVAVGGVLYVQTGQGDVFAVNGATGKVAWEYKSGFAGTERGVAVAGGRVFAALGGEHVVALNQKTGALIWRAQVGTPGQDTAANGAATPWTLYFHGLVLVGTENGGAAGMRGHLYALRASTGAVAWSFAGTAGPGQPGHNTWKGSSWKLGGGDVWMAPAVDPQLGLIYLAVANPEPRVDGAARAGNDLYTNSLVALRASTGKLAWYFQSVHHDLWDYDDTMSPVIADVRYHAGVRKVVIYGSKTGWLYYLNAQTGKPAVGVREKKVPGLASQATSATQPIPQGDSLVPTCPSTNNSTRPIPDFTSGCEFTPYLHTPILVTPGGAGGADWALMSFDQRTGLLYVAASETDFAYSDGQPYGQPTFWRPAGAPGSGLLDAVNPRTNTIVWHQPATYGLSDGDGILSTAGGLLFEGTEDGLLTARSAATGKLSVGLAGRHRDHGRADHLHGRRPAVRGRAGGRCPGAPASRPGRQPGGVPDRGRAEPGQPAAARPHPAAGGRPGGGGLGGARHRGPGPPVGRRHRRAGHDRGPGQRGGDGAAGHDRAGGHHGDVHQPGREREGPLRGVVLRPGQLQGRPAGARPVGHGDLRQGRHLLLQRLRGLPLGHRRDHRRLAGAAPGQRARF